MLLCAQYAFALAYLVFFVIPHSVQNEAWSVVYDFHALMVASRLLIFPGLPIGTALALMGVVFATAFRNNMTKHELR